MLKQLKLKSQKMSAAMMTGAMVGTFSTTASAQPLNDYLGTTSERVNQVPDLVAFLSYIGGTALAALGVLGLKKHVEDPGQNPMKNGLAKLGFGGMLLALPSITNVMVGTSSAGTAGGANFSTFNSNPSLN
jgi:hypothetical protein